MHADHLFACILAAILAAACANVPEPAGSQNSSGGAAITAADSGSGDPAEELDTTASMDTQQVSSSCGPLNGYGCCAGDLNKYCSVKETVSDDWCGDSGCGWDPGHGYYACGFTGADPSGLQPRTCPAGRVRVGEPDATDALSIQVDSETGTSEVKPACAAVDEPCTQSKDCCGSPSQSTICTLGEQVCRKVCMANGDCATGCCAPLGNGKSICGSQKKCPKTCTNAAQCDDADKCTTDQCMSGLCVSTSLVCAGSCDPALGCPCTNKVQCGNNEACVSGQCTVVAGTTCQKANPVSCPLPFKCLSNKCYMPDGGGCASNADCPPMTVCDPSSHCLPGKGDPCISGLACANGLKCTATGTCGGPVGAPCESHAQCDTGVCQTETGVGCAKDAPCKCAVSAFGANYCSAGQCQSTPSGPCVSANKVLGICKVGPGAACGPDAACASPYQCTASACLLPAGAPCTSGTYCPPGLVCDKAKGNVCAKPTQCVPLCGECGSNGCGGTCGPNGGGCPSELLACQGGKCVQVKCYNFASGPCAKNSDCCPGNLCCLGANFGSVANKCQCAGG